MPHTDLTANIVTFCRLLRAHGLPLGPGEQSDALRALSMIDIGDHPQFRGALRTLLAKDQPQQAVFDLCFDIFWHQAAEDQSTRPPELPPPQRQAPPAMKVENHQAPLAGADGDDDPEADEMAMVPVYSPTESLVHKDFSGFTASELREVVEIVNMIARALANRVGRRRQRHGRRGMLDLRNTIRRNLRHGGEVLDLQYCNRKPQKLRLCLLMDVSQSMDLYSHMLVQFIYAFQNAYRNIESFVFSTSLYRVTDLLKHHDFQAVLQAISEQVPGWSGGTRIGASLQSFIDDHGTSLDRRTVVLVMSDGWDTGEIDQLGKAMRTIQNRAAAVFWLNPLCGTTDYQPTCRGMEAALPYIDVFAAAHNLASLRALGRRLAAV
ncbi:MAG: VWA domain-containing protein [Lentisphaeria bacterium]|nr:VWA domain-containing protein [Lentisphaeria bacterium]